MKLWKRITAAVTTLCMMFTCFACGEDTGIAMTVDGYDVRAGIYLYYVVNAYNDAISVATENGETFADCETTKDIKKILKKTTIDDISAEEWIQNKATESCIEYVAIQREFDRLELKLSGEDIADIDSSLAGTLTFFDEFFEDSGISEESARDILVSQKKLDLIWQAYYGEDGSVGVKEDTLYDYYAENYLRYKYISMPLKDGKGNLLKADGKAEIEKMAKDYLARLEKKSDNEADLMKEFDYLIDEHEAYVTSLSKAAVTTTDANGSTVTTATTAKLTTTEKTTTTPAETTTDSTETTVVGETTTTSETTTTTTTTTTAAETTDTTGTGTSATTTTTTTNPLGYEVDEEVIVAVSTSATEDEQPEGEETTTTTAPKYTPCQKVYEWVIDEDTDYNEPTFIKDDECYYIVMKMDIEDRMTESDLWSDNAKESVRSTIYYEEFEAMMDKDIYSKFTEQRNEKAYKRYKVLDVDVVEYQAALMESYYSYYYGYGG